MLFNIDIFSELIYNKTKYDKLRVKEDKYEVGENSDKLPSN